MDGSIKFDVSATTARFDAAMARTSSVAATTATKIRGAFSGLGSLLAGGVIIGGIQNILSKMDDVSDAAKRLGASTDDIQRVGNAAQIVGTDMDTVARAMNRMGVSANKAAREGGSIAEAFARVDIDPAAFAAASLADRIGMVAKAQKAANGDATKMAELLEVVGVRAAGINFAELVSEMQQVNVASAQTVEELARANDELDKMKQNAAIFGATLLKALLVDPSQRLGSFLGGEGFKTQDEVARKYERLATEQRLIEQGAQLPSEPMSRNFALDVEIERLKREKENAKSLASAESDVANELSEQGAQRNNILELGLQIKEADAAGNHALADKLRYQDDIEKGILKYKDAEDAYGMAVRDANAELEKRQQILERADKNKAGRPASVAERRQQMRGDLVEEFDQRMRDIHSTDPTSANTPEDRAKLFENARRARQLHEDLQLANMDIERNLRDPDSYYRPPAIDTGENARRQQEERERERRDTMLGATESTLQKVADFLEELNTKLPQPVLA